MDARDAAAAAEHAERDAAAGRRATRARDAAAQPMCHGRPATGWRTRLP